MLPEEKYYNQLLLAIYYPKSKRIILHTKWKVRYNTIETAIHEYAHHLHCTEFLKEDLKQEPHWSRSGRFTGSVSAVLRNSASLRMTYCLC